MYSGFYSLHTASSMLLLALFNPAKAEMLEHNTKLIRGTFHSHPNVLQSQECFEYLPSGMRKQPLVFSESVPDYVVSTWALSADLHQLLSGDMQEALVTQRIITRYMHFKIINHQWLLKEPFCESLLKLIHFEQCLCLWSFSQGQTQSEPQAEQKHC